MTQDKNERATENVVREALRSLGYYDTTNDISIEEQKSNIDNVKRLLRTASKSGKGGKGAPEFIISSPSTPDFLLVIECKADINNHISATCKDLLDGKEIEEEEDSQSKRIVKYSVDGVLHYASKLSKDYNVIAVAVSGQTEKDCLISWAAPLS